MRARASTPSTLISPRVAELFLRRGGLVLAPPAGVAGLAAEEARSHPRVMRVALGRVGDPTAVSTNPPAQPGQQSSAFRHAATVADGSGSQRTSCTCPGSLAPIASYGPTISVELLEPLNVPTTTVDSIVWFVLLLSSSVAAGA